MDIKQLKTISLNFAQELRDTQDGKKTSLPFIIHELSSSPIVRDGESFMSLVIGGTVAKVATLRKNGNGIQILDKKEQQLSFRTEEDFLAFVEGTLPDNINVLALNFAYPMTPVFENGRLDGVLLAVKKEGGFHDLVGKQVGKEVENYLMAKRNKKIKVAVANDTVCLLTSGLSEFKEEELAAGIVGTGFNIAFFLGKNKLVNLESANFDKFPQTKEGQIVDKESVQPGRSLFEKETAGAYLYKHFNLIIKNRNIAFPPINSTEELSALCHPEFISGSKNTNRKKMLNQVQHDMVRASEIARSLLARSAQLVACQIAGITEFKEHDMVFNMEGSLFWKGNRYKETVEQTVKQLIPQYKIKFVEIQDSGILGAAKLVS